MNLERYPNGLDDLPFDSWYCTKCKSLKSKYEFYFAPSSTYGIKNLCKECHKKKQLKLNPTEKQCSRCKKVKSVVDFSLDRFRKRGLKSWCKFCVIEYQKHRRKRANYKRVSDDTLVKCSRCEDTKEAINFRKYKHKKNGLLSWCKSCEAKGIEKKKYERIEDHVLVKCSKCGGVKRASDFHINRNKKNGLSSWCKACARIIAYR